MEITQSNHFSILDYSDYRICLQALFANKQRLNRRFSFRRFAAVVGFKSPNYLQMILDGRRNLTAQTAAIVASKLKLSNSERDYFLAMVQGANAKTAAEKTEAEKCRLVAIRKLVSRDIASAQTEVFSRWYYLLVRELFLLPNAKSDPKWIQQKLGGCITEDEARESVELLCRCGFLERTANGYKPVEPVLDTDEQSLQATMMRNLHAATLNVWSQNLDRLAPKDQELGILNLPIDTAKLPELRSRIRAFQDEIIGWVQSDTTPDRVVQLGTYMIPY